MRFLMINLFLVCLLLFGIGYLAFGHDETKATSESHTRYVGDASWDAELETFYKLLKTDPEAARVELQSVAKALFNEHPRAEEWIELRGRALEEAVAELVQENLAKQVE